MHVGDGFKNESKARDNEPEHFNWRDRTRRIGANDQRGKRQKRRVGETLCQHFNLSCDRNIGFARSSPANSLILVPRKLALECTHAPELEREDTHPSSHENIERADHRYAKPLSFTHRERHCSDHD